MGYKGLCEVGPDYHIMRYIHEINIYPCLFLTDRYRVRNRNRRDRERNTFLVTRRVYFDAVTVLSPTMNQ